MAGFNDEQDFKINGCAMKVHNTLGNGFQEVIYQRCLAIELELAQAKNYVLEQLVYNSKKFLIQSITKPIL